MSPLHLSTEGGWSHQAVAYSSLTSHLPPAPPRSVASSPHHTISKRNFIHKRVYVFILVFAVKNILYQREKKGKTLCGTSCPSKFVGKSFQSGVISTSSKSLVRLVCSP